jgi:hypothetical protein
MPRYRTPRHLERWRNTRLRCDCGNYWFPHRRGGGACAHANPGKRDYYLMLRAGVPESVAMAELSVSDLERLYPL